MKIGIDNYSYHRYFNEVYPGQPSPDEQWDLTKFIDHISRLPDLPLVEGLSIETCFLPADDKNIIAELSRLNLPFIFQWGHPNGFMDISLEQVSEQMHRFLVLSRKFKSKYIRIVASSIDYFGQPHNPQIQHALHYLEKILPLAESYNIKLAIENHGDFLLREIKTIIDKFDTPYLGAIVDTGNFLRMNENPRDAISIFGEKLYLVHAKDVAIMPGYTSDDPRRFGCVPAGKGDIDFPGIFNDLEQQAYDGMVLLEISRMHPSYEQMGEIEMLREGLQYLHSVRAEEGHPMQRAEDNKKTLKIGILGNGFMGRMRAHAYTTVAHMFPDLPVRPELYAISGVDEISLKEFAACFNFQYYTTNWLDIVEDEAVDIISICLPEHLHMEPALRACKAKKHVFCEKALAFSTSSAFAMTQAAQGTNKINMCGFNYRFLPAIQLARNLIRDDQLGQVYTVRASYFQESGHDPARPAEEVLYAFGDHPLGSSRGLGSHVIDACRFLVGEMKVRHALFKTFIPERRTRHGKIYPVETDDFATMTVEFASGGIGILSTSKVATGRKNWFSFEINGSKGSLQFDVEDLNILRLYLDKGPSSDLRGFTKINVTEKSHPLMAAWWPPAHNLGWEHSHINEIHHFLECVAKNQSVGPLGATFEDGYRAIELAEQAEQLSNPEQTSLNNTKEVK